MPTEATWYEEIKAIVYKFIVGWSTVPKSSDDLVKKLVPILKYNIGKQTLFFHWIIIFVIVEILEILFNSSSVLKYELFLYSSFQKLISTVCFIVVWSVQYDIIFPNCMIININ